MSLQAAITQRSLAFAQRMAQATADGARNSLVLVTRGGGWNPDLHEYDATYDEVIYDHPDPTLAGSGGPAGITTQSGSQQSDYADESSYTSTVRVMLPQSAPRNPRIDDQVLVLASPDQDVVGEWLRVVDVEAGGRLTASITMTCTLTPPSREVEA